MARRPRYQPHPKPILAQTVSLPNYTEPNLTAPVPTQTYTLTVDPTREYVSGGGYAWLANYIRSLPFWIDDVTRDFGDDIYARMGFDPQVKSSVRFLKMAVTEQGVTFSAATEGIVSDADKALAEEIATFAQANIEGLERPLSDVLYEMLDAIVFGHMVAEQIYHPYAESPIPGKLCLRVLKVKPRRATAFVVDVFYNVLGLLAMIPGQGMPILANAIVASPDQIPNLVARDHFAVLAFEPQANDPRGTSLLRSAYNAWNLKMQVWPEYFKFLAQFASPSLVGYTAPDAQDVPKTDPDGNLILDTNGNPQNLTPEQAMLQALLQFRSGMAMAFPHGAEVTSLGGKVDGRAYLEGIALMNEEIVKAILAQTLATSEGEHQARAASETHGDVLALVVRFIKRCVENMLRKDVLRPLIAANYGDQAAQRMLPKVSLGDTENQDMAKMFAGIAALQSSGYLHWSQYEEMDALLGLPPRDMAAQMAEIARAEAAAADLQANISEATNKQVAKKVGGQTAGRVANDAVRAEGDTQE